MRDVKQLHPELQEKLTLLQKKALEEGIKIKFAECLRTVVEQEALYAKGRTTSGHIVTNARGNSYASMHQWGVAADFYLDMDVDGDGNKADDAYNNAKKMFDKVGKIAVSIGLIWGGNWKSIKDLPHVQLANWGDTPKRLKALYKTPSEFFKTWSKAPAKTGQNAISLNGNGTKTPASKSDPVPAACKASKYAGVYDVVAKSGLNLRLAAPDGGVIATIPKASEVTCYGYYERKNNSIWLFVQYGKYTGYVSKHYLNFLRIK
nr:MAG TPA: hypothetical protein [Caudoviricetes sp.]